MESPGFTPDRRESDQSRGAPPSPPGRSRESDSVLEPRYTLGMSAPDPLTSEQVRKVATLARLELSDEMVDRLRGQLGAVLGYMERLKELDLSKAEPLASPVDEKNRLRPDEPGETLSNETLMTMAPETMPPFLKVPKVVGSSEG